MNDVPRHNEDVALFIDWENFKISLASGSRAPNVSALKEEVSNYGRVVVAKAYADWVTRSPELKGASQFTLDPPALYAAGIEPVYVPTRLPQGGTSDSTKTFRVKNSVDVKMTADCIECAHSYSNINTYVLVSGDSDFIHVINTLRAMGKRVIIIGVSWSTSRRLADQVDGLILYDADVDPVTPSEPATASGNGRSTSKLSSSSKQQLPEVIRAIEEIVRSERQAGRTTLLTSLKQRLMRRIPGFDEKKLGFSGFKKLMQWVAQEGNVKLVTVGLVDWVMMADEPDPREGAPEVPDTSEAATDTVGAVQLGVVQSGTKEDESSFTDELDTPRAVAPARNKREKQFKPSKSREQSEGTQTPTVGISDAIATLELPEGPNDQQDSERVADLIVMADTLEHREGVSHVAFNFLVSEICNALGEGLKAENDTIIQHWGEAHSRTYVTKLLRALGNSGVFQRGWHTGKDKETGRAKRRSTFNLNRDHHLVQKVLEARWATSHPDEPTTFEALSDDLPEIETDLLSSPAESDFLFPNEGSEVTGPDTPSGIGRVMRLFSRS
jgi:uncharacterized LabA/DUF88 family protein